MSTGIFRLREMEYMQKLLKVAYVIVIPAIVMLLAIACGASAVWGS